MVNLLIELRPISPRTVGSIYPHRPRRSPDPRRHRSHRKPSLDRQVCVSAIAPKLLERQRPARWFLRLGLSWPTSTESQIIEYQLEELFVAMHHDLEVGVLVAPGGVLPSTDDFTSCRVVDNLCTWD